MKELKVVNRIAVMIIILGATAISFANINIIEFIHIATYIASAAYFFPLMVGLYWKRATKEGAIAALVVGGVAQITMVLIDLTMSTGGTYYIESLHMVLTGHGVILSMTLSALTIVVVSLMTKKSSVYNLAPFFPKEAKALERDEVSKVNTESDEYGGYREMLSVVESGERDHLQLDLKASTPLNWDKFIDELKKSNEAWFTSSGKNVLYRLTHGDLLSCPSISRGNNEQEIWISAEPRVESTDIAQVEIYLAYSEIQNTLKSMGIFTDFIAPQDQKAI